MVNILELINLAFSNNCFSMIGVEGTSQQEPTGTKLSIGMRQSAEGDVVTSPIPGDGGGGGDGSSGSEE